VSVDSTRQERPSVKALIMAGGSGERMRASGSAVPKPLVEVMGTSLLERNLHQVFAAGFDDVCVSMSTAIPEVGQFLRTRGLQIARRWGATLTLLEEQQPLGNIGCAGRLQGAADHVLVVYADNLTAIDLARLLSEHLDSGAALTLAVHDEPFRLPFGQVYEAGDRIVNYVEKPEHRFAVCSAVSALSDVALRGLPADRPTSISELARELIAAGAYVRSFRHTAPWIDVNDLAAVARAEALIAAHQDAFALPADGAMMQRAAAGCARSSIPDQGVSTLCAPPT
jgi:NDP-sugar pyrophosphorylase family protein